MAGIGDRMNAGSITFRNGVPIDMPGNPLPDDETLERLRKQGEAWCRAVPQTVGAEPRPLSWCRPESDAGDAEQRASPVFDGVRGPPGEKAEVLTDERGKPL